MKRMHGVRYVMRVSLMVAAAALVRGTAQNAGSTAQPEFVLEGKSQARAKAAPSDKDKPVMIKLYFSADRALVMLRVGGRFPVPVVFDTGTSGNLIDSGLAMEWHLPKTGPSSSFDEDGRQVPGFDTFIKGAELGGTPIADQPASAVTYNLPDEVGIFGPNSFPNSLVRFEGPRSRVVIEPKSAASTPCGEPFSYIELLGDFLPSATLDLGGVKIQAELDTGNTSEILLPLSYKDKLALDGPPIKSGISMTAAGPQQNYSARLKGSARIAGVTIDQPMIKFIVGGIPNVGLPILRKLTIVLAPSEHHDWIVPSDAAASPCTY